MNHKHVGELKIIDDKSFMNYKGLVDDLIFDRTNELTFNFKKYSIDIHESIVELQEDGTIKIECLFYNNKLYNAYKHKDKIVTLEVKGMLVNINDKSKMFPYLQIYKKYKFMSVQGSFEYDGHWIYILKPCL